MFSIERTSFLRYAAVIANLGPILGPLVAKIAYDNTTRKVHFGSKGIRLGTEFLDFLNKVTFEDIDSIPALEEGLGEQRKVLVPPIYLIGPTDVRAQLLPSVLHAQQLARQFEPTQGMSPQRGVLVFAVSGKIQEHYFRNVGSPMMLKSAPMALLGAHCCTINTDYLNLDLKRAVQRATTHEVIHALQQQNLELGLNEKGTPSAFFLPPTDLNSMAHEAIAALPPEMWSDVDTSVFEHIRFPRIGIDDDFWIWYEGETKRLNLESIPFFLNPIAASFSLFVHKTGGVQAWWEAYLGKITPVKTPSVMSYHQRKRGVY